MLRKIRLILAMLSFSLITMLFLDFTGTFHHWFGWLAKVQFVPALLALNAGVIVFLIALTLLFGRVYCSVICPLGVLQDIVSDLSRRVNKKKRRFSFSPPLSLLRYGLLAVFTAGIILGIGSLVALLDPYGAYGRIGNSLFLPVYQGISNVLAHFAERIDSYTFYPVEVWLSSIFTLLIALGTIILIGVLAWKNGRTYCNAICPVGTVLGFFSRFSLFRPAFDMEKCTKCGLCERNCKASCIDSKHMSIDHSRCVTCFNCMEKCNFGAMKYVPRKMGKEKAVQSENVSMMTDKPNKGVSRQNFLSISGLFFLANTVKAQQLQVDGGLAEIKDKKAPDRKVAIVPPGAEGIKNFNTHCTACQLCVTVCPNKVLRPSHNLSTLMQPEMSYERGYCRPECTECSKVCPTNAIKHITLGDKSAIAIGQAVWIKENCVVNTDGLPCDACERHCPTSAITLVPLHPEDEETKPQQGGAPFGRQPVVLKIPTVNKELCIGCGACEYYCPSRPFSAMYVEGNLRHHLI